jgi:hypothetical protein
MWFWKRRKLSKTLVNEIGQIVEPVKEIEDDFTIKDFIELLKAGAKIIDAIREYEKEEKKKGGSPKSL